MESYLLQSALLMLAAYFVGAILGCFLRSRLTAGSTETPPLGTGSTAEANTRAAPTVATANRREAPEPVQPRIETVAQPAPRDEAKVAESVRFERSLSSAPAVAREPAITQPAAREIVVETAEPRLPTAGGNLGLSAVAATIISPPADDLRRIHNIDDQTANELNQLGYIRFWDIANWSGTDAVRVRKGFGERPARECWIEQAKILADGKETRHSAKGAGTALPNPWEVISQTTTPTTPAPSPATPMMPAPTPPVPAPALPEPTVSVPDDLTRIAGIDTATAHRLAEHGITSYAVIAGWTAAEVERFDGLLGEDGRISRQNWIEQAKMLADGRETSHVRRIMGEDHKNPWEDLPAPPASAASTALPADSLAAAQPGPAEEPTSAIAPDDLTHIDGIDTATARRLADYGVTDFATIAKWTVADAERYDGLFGEAGRISRQNWIEQARILASGGHTADANRLDQSPAAAPPAPVDREPIGSAAAPSPAEPSVPVTVHPTSPPRPGSVAAAGGVAIASLRGADTDRSAGMPSAVTASPEPEPSQLPGESTIETPKPRPSRLAEAIRQNVASGGLVRGSSYAASSVAGMRSVRSHLLSGDTAPPAGATDDLKKIRGVGVLIERKLNAMGVYTYDQIANWSSDEIERISGALDFKGRIEREGWVQQARILSSGGQTEFSRRHT